MLDLCYVPCLGIGDSAMKRRAFIGLIGGAAVSPLAARAQQSGKPRTIGFFSANTASSASRWTDAFVHRLRDLGWIEGRTVAIEYRWGEGGTEHTAEFVAEFIRLKVDVIVTHGTPNILAAKQATSTIPIVFALASDPVNSGFVTSLARPGGNVTGLSIEAPDLASKRLDLLREVVRGLRRLAIMANMGLPANVLEVGEVQAAARALGIEVAPLDVRRAEEITSVFETLKGRADALYVSAAPLVTTNQIRINTLALSARLPTMHGAREYVEAGGLMSYGPNFPDLFRRAADYVDKILRGSKPADIPVEQPTKFDLVVNLATAKALGLNPPPTLLARADEVIE
jgi:putative ABC transport system substrate-binding protein